MIRASHETYAMKHKPCYETRTMKHKHSFQIVPGHTCHKIHMSMCSQLYMSSYSSAAFVYSYLHSYSSAAFVYSYLHST